MNSTNISVMALNTHTGKIDANVSHEHGLNLIVAFPREEAFALPDGYAYSVRCKLVVALDSSAPKTTCLRKIGCDAFCDGIAYVGIDPKPSSYADTRQVVLTIRARTLLNAETAYLFLMTEWGLCADKTLELQ